MRYLFVCMMLAVIAGGCGSKVSGDADAVPRRRAYPRIELPDSAFTFIQTESNGLSLAPSISLSLPLSLAINNATEYAVHSKEGNASLFIDVDYPGLNAAIYFTITPVDNTTLAAVIDNRLERVSLNLGGADAELLEFDSPAGFENKVFVSRADISTPVQFIATDGETTVISGTSFLKDASAANADSLAPVVNMLRRDILHTLKTLHR